MKVTLFIPVLNESEGIRLIMPQIKKESLEQILFVDGNSTDGTVELVKSMGYEVYIQKEKGLRNAYKEAWPLIRGDAVITFSPDGNCLTQDIPKLISKFKEGYDMVIASRYYQGAKSEDDDLLTSFGNWLFTKSINFFHGGHYTDAMTIYRIYRKNLFYELDLDKDETYLPYEKIFHTHIGVEPILSIRAAKMKLKIADIPSDEPKRIGGQRKLQVLRWGAAYYSQILCEIFCWRKKRK